MIILNTKKQIKIIISYIKSFLPRIQFSIASSENKNIIFILHSNDHKAGGDKVIYRQSELINKLDLNGFSSQILHPENPSFKHTWFEHSATFKKNLQLDPKSDFVVLPEVWALPYAKLLNNINVKYAIYVQNGYIMNIPISIGYSYHELFEAYNKASLILSISDDTTECLRQAFPAMTTEIIRIYCSLDQAKFKPNSQKQNVITYMPRKLAYHSKMLLFFLNSSLPKHWKIEAIDGLNEEGVIDILSRSKIFMSFSEFEGFGLPPLEAALSGNQVVGYTGEGGKEFWDYPMFTHVHCGDIRTYVKEVLSKIQQLEQNSAVDMQCIDLLANKYSLETEKNSVSKFIIAVDKILKN